ncbi:MAG: copper amine oxidase N-terminal protein [Paenibacillaceae bacterium]|jgi:hypothetical protein|nr:copper amine oxidase N-terminal protein [Paenibacillaceae bacterium]
MRRSTKRFGIVLALFSMMAAIIGGCQAIGSVDLNKALLSSFDMKTMEGKGTVEVSLDLDQAALEEAGPDSAQLAAFSQIKLNFDHIKQENTQTASVKGSLEVAKKTIPFTAYISPEALSVLPEGATKPLTLSTQNLADPTGEGLYDGLDMAWLTDFQKKSADPNYIKPLYEYLLGKLPNPSNLKLESGNETINGQSVYLHHVRAELAGKDILPLLRTFILNLMKDDQAMKAVIAQYYDVIQGAVNSFIPAGAGDDMGELGSALAAVRSILENKEEGVEVVQTEAKQLLVILLVLLDSEGTEAVKFLGDQSSLTADLYVDSSMKVRKSGINLLLAPSETDGSPVKSIRVKSSFENWNVNGTVKSDAISTAGALDLAKLEGPEGLLEALKADSALYKLLKDDLHVTRKTGYFYVLPKEELDEYTAGWAAYNDSGVTMVPARSLAANLDMDLAWDEASQSVALTTAGGKTSIRLTAGSSKAAVNGAAELSLERPAVVEQGALYVPLRSVSEALGAQIQWHADSSSILVTLD